MVGFGAGYLQFAPACFRHDVQGQAVGFKSQYLTEAAPERGERGYFDPDDPSHARSPSPPPQPSPAARSASPPIGQESPDRAPVAAGDDPVAPDEFWQLLLELIRNEPAWKNRYMSTLLAQEEGNGEPCPKDVPNTQVVWPTRPMLRHPAWFLARMSWILDPLEAEDQNWAPKFVVLLQLLVRAAPALNHPKVQAAADSAFRSMAIPYQFCYRKQRPRPQKPTIARATWWFSGKSLQRRHGARLSVFDSVEVEGQAEGEAVILGILPPGEVVVCTAGKEGRLVETVRVAAGKVTGCVEGTGHKELARLGILHLAAVGVRQTQDALPPVLLGRRTGLIMPAIPDLADLRQATPSATLSWLATFIQEVTSRIWLPPTHPWRSHLGILLRGQTTLDRHSIEQVSWPLGCMDQGVGDWWGEELPMGFDLNDPGRGKVADDVRDLCEWIARTVAGSEAVAATPQRLDRCRRAILDLVESVFIGEKRLWDALHQPSSLSRLVMEALQLTRRGFDTQRLRLPETSRPLQVHFALITTPAGKSPCDMGAGGEAGGRERGVMSGTIQLYHWQRDKVHHLQCWMEATLGLKPGALLVHIRGVDGARGPALHPDFPLGGTMPSPGASMWVHDPHTGPEGGPIEVVPDAFYDSLLQLPGGTGGDEADHRLGNMLSLYHELVFEVVFDVLHQSLLEIVPDLVEGASEGRPGGFGAPGLPTAVEGATAAPQALPSHSSLMHTVLLSSQPQTATVLQTMKPVDLIIQTLNIAAQDPSGAAAHIADLIIELCSAATGNQGVLHDCCLNELKEQAKSRLQPAIAPPADQCFLLCQTARQALWSVEVAPSPVWNGPISLLGRCRLLASARRILYACFPNADTTSDDLACCEKVLKMSGLRKKLLSTVVPTTGRGETAPRLSTGALGAAGLYETLMNAAKRPAYEPRWEQLLDELTFQELDSEGSRKRTAFATGIPRLSLKAGLAKNLHLRLSQTQGVFAALQEGAEGQNTAPINTTVRETDLRATGSLDAHVCNATCKEGPACLPLGLTGVAAQMQAGGAKRSRPPPTEGTPQPGGSPGTTPVPWAGSDSPVTQQPNPLPPTATPRCLYMVCEKGMLGEGLDRVLGPYVLCAGADASAPLCWARRTRDTTLHLRRTDGGQWVVSEDGQSPTPAGAAPASTILLFSTGPPEADPYAESQAWGLQPPSADHTIELIPTLRIQLEGARRLRKIKRAQLQDAMRPGDQDWEAIRQRIAAIRDEDPMALYLTRLLLLDWMYPTLTQLYLRASIGMTIPCLLRLILDKDPPSGPLGYAYTLLWLHLPWAKEKAPVLVRKDITFWTLLNCHIPEADVEQYGLFRGDKPILLGLCVAGEKVLQGETLHVRALPWTGRISICLPGRNMATIESAESTWTTQQLFQTAATLSGLRENAFYLRWGEWGLGAPAQTTLGALGIARGGSLTLVLKPWQGEISLAVPAGSLKAAHVKEIKAQSSWPLQKLFQEVERASGIHRDHFYLRWAMLCLPCDTDTTLLDYGLPQGSIVQMILRLRGGMPPGKGGRRRGGKGHAALGPRAAGIGAGDAEMHPHDAGSPAQAHQSSLGGRGEDDMESEAGSGVEDAEEEVPLDPATMSTLALLVGRQVRLHGANAPTAESMYSHLAASVRQGYEESDFLRAFESLGLKRQATLDPTPLDRVKTLLLRSASLPDLNFLNLGDLDEQELPNYVAQASFFIQTHLRPALASEELSLHRTLFLLHTGRGDTIQAVGQDETETLRIWAPCTQPQSLVLALRDEGFEAPRLGAQRIQVSAFQAHSNSGMAGTTTNGYGEVTIRRTPETLRKLDELMRCERPLLKEASIASSMISVKRNVQRLLEDLSSEDPVWTPDPEMVLEAPSDNDAQIFQWTVALLTALGLPSDLVRTCLCVAISDVSDIAVADLWPDPGYTLDEALGRRHGRRGRLRVALSPLLNPPHDRAEITLKFSDLLLGYTEAATLPLLLRKLDFHLVLRKSDALTERERESAATAVFTVQVDDPASWFASRYADNGGEGEQGGTSPVLVEAWLARHIICFMRRHLPLSTGWIINEHTLSCELTLTAAGRIGNTTKLLVHLHPTTAEWNVFTAAVACTLALQLGFLVACRAVEVDFLQWCPLMSLVPEYPNQDYPERCGLLRITLNPVYAPDGHSHPSSRPRYQLGSGKYTFGDVDIGRDTFLQSLRDLFLRRTNRLSPTDLVRLAKLQSGHMSSAARERHEREISDSSGPYCAKDNSIYVGLHTPPIVDRIDAAFFRPVPVADTLYSLLIKLESKLGRLGSGMRSSAGQQIRELWGDHICLAWLDVDLRFLLSANELVNIYAQIHEPHEKELRSIFLPTLDSLPLSPDTTAPFCMLCRQTLSVGFLEESKSLAHCIPCLVRGLGLEAAGRQLQAWSYLSRCAQSLHFQPPTTASDGSRQKALRTMETGPELAQLLAGQESWTGQALDAQGQGRTDRGSFGGVTMTYDHLVESLALWLETVASLAQWIRESRPERTPLAQETALITQTLWDQIVIDARSLKIFQTKWAERATGLAGANKLHGCPPPEEAQAQGKSSWSTGAGAGRRTTAAPTKTPPRPPLREATTPQGAQGFTTDDRDSSTLTPYGQILSHSEPPPGHSQTPPLLSSSGGSK